MCFPAFGKMPFPCHIFCWLFYLAFIWTFVFYINWITISVHFQIQFNSPSSSHFNPIKQLLIIFICFAVSIKELLSRTQAPNPNQCQLSRFLLEKYFWGFFASNRFLSVMADWNPLDGTCFFVYQDPAKSSIFSNSQCNLLLPNQKFHYSQLLTIVVLFYVLFF